MQSRLKWWWAASIVAHASLFTVAATSVPARDTRPASGARIDFEYPPARADDASRATASGEARAAAPDDRARRYGGARSAQNVSADNPGERGDGRSLEVARRLAARADGVNLDPRLVNNAGATQEQRIRTARERASPQDDRRTPNPAEDPWVASSHGVLLVRMTDAPTPPGEGARVRAGAAAAAGEAASSHASPVGTLDTERASAERRAGAVARLTAGVRDADRGAARAAGPVAFQRPSVERGHASTTADQAALRPDDDTDAAMLAASLMRAHVSASAQEGPTRAEGSGGVGGGGAPGSGGGLGRGGVARALGEGDGALSITTGDARYVRYFGLVKRRLDRLIGEAFPREDALQLRQGTVIVTFVIERDGRVRDVAIVRRSGVPGYDANARAALATTRMPPIPAEIVGARIAIRAPLEFLNPVVR